jgi:signal peptidase I
VDIKDGFVSVDGKKLDEPYVMAPNRDAYTLPQPVRVPDGYVWVMGDNRANSSDSRVIGPQPMSSILGKAFVIYWPIDRLRGL